MRIALLAAAWLCASAAGDPASAEDFTGFYAGVNAGYASGRGDADRTGASAPGAAAASGDGLNALPPSAQDASRSLQARKRSPASEISLPR